MSALRLEIKILGQEGSKPITIRNPSATGTNLRASIALALKLVPASFRITHATINLDDETKKLSDLGLKDGDELFIAMKRDRDGAEIPAPVLQASPGARATPPTATATKAAVAPPATSTVLPPMPALLPIPAGAAPFRLERLVQLGWSKAESERILATGGSDIRRVTELLLASLYGTSPSAAPAGGASVPAEPNVAEGEESSLSGEEDEEDDEEMSDSEEDEEELGDLGELDLEGHQDFLRQLMSLENVADLPQRFRENPEALMQEIRSTRPDVFNAIVQNAEFFHTFISRADIGGEVDAEDEEDEEPAPRRGVASVSVAPTTAPAALTEADNAAIDNLMALGFSREQAQAAYLRAGRNPDRAAGILFGN